jgi:PIN domain nuclease of toxin-antitoxin system
MTLHVKCLLTCRILEFLNYIKNIKGLVIYDIDAEVAGESVSLPGNFHGDPAERLIVSTSRV